MKGLRDIRKQLCCLSDSGFFKKSGLLRMGIVSMLIHIGLLVFFGLSLVPAIPKGGPALYQVTLQPLFPPEREIPHSKQSPNLNRVLPLPSGPRPKSQIEKVKNELEIKKREPPKHWDEEEVVQEPTPLPMGGTSPLNMDLDIKDNSPALLTPSPHEKPHEDTIQDTGSIEIASQVGSGRGGLVNGSGSGEGGIGGTEEGEGFGGEDSAMGSSGKGQVTDRRGFHRERLGRGFGSSGKGIGSGQGGSGWGFGDGSGPGRGYGGWGGSGRGGTGLNRPRYAENPKPTYPLEAREKGQQGEVVLRVEILPNGRVGQIEVKKSSGYEVLDRSAMETLKKWKFIPARKGDIAISFWVIIPIRFQLL